MKAGASRWVHEEYPLLRHFAWQEDFSIFSLSIRGLDRVQGYIGQQEEHHREKNFREELRGFLDEHKIVYDERYS